METLKFKTNIKCSGCVEKATPLLNQAVGEGNWKVDIQNPYKVLSIVSDKQVAEAEIIKAVREAGFNAEKLN